MKLQAVGYKALIEQFNIETIENWHYSSISIENHTHKLIENSAYLHEIYPKKYAIEDEIVQHLEFALKYDGVNLGLLTLITK